MLTNLDTSQPNFAYLRTT